MRYLTQSLFFAGAIVVFVVMVLWVTLLWQITLVMLDVLKHLV